MDLNNAGTLLQRRRKSVNINKEEVLLILRAYANHPTSWPEILEEVRQNLDVLLPGAREMYTTGSLRQLRDRMSSKLSSLIKQRSEDIADADIRSAVENVRRLERRHIPDPEEAQQQPAQQQPAQQQPARQPPAQHQPAQQMPRAPDRGARAERAGPARPPADHRADMAAALSSDDDEAEQRHPRVQERRRRQRKRPMTELIRENQEAYNKFITKKFLS